VLVNMKERIGEEAVRELLAYAVYPDPEQLESAVRRYAADDHDEIYGLDAEGELIAIAGIALDEERRLEVKHLAVHPEYRGQGYGRGIILELIALKAPTAVSAETDEEAIDFYRNIGFSVTGLGEKYPGVERFLCIYDVEETED
jgi:ribosomal protein S18 acetylase RimI-like enzyme